MLALLNNVEIHPDLTLQEQQMELVTSYFRRMFIYTSRTHVPKID
jgi:hypothetical protein